jgi:hypothetical protein
MTILWSNNASTNIAGSITSTDTTVALSAGTGVEFPNPTGGNYFKATFYDQATKTINEIVHVTAMAGDVATIVRGQEGTTAQAWNAGDIFANLITAGTLEAFVQTGFGPADTSVVYVGDDTSTDNRHIVANTIPVPPNFALGMLFNIRMKNTKFPDITTGVIDIQLNGRPAVAVKRTDGSNFLGSELVGNQEFIFIYNGVYFSTTMIPVPLNPPQTVFYVRSDSLSTLNMTTGRESATGFANTPQEAFKTIQGAINTIRYRYISQQTITVRVADGTYSNGFTIRDQYIASWHILGNAANPGLCIVNATSTSAASYIPGSTPGIGAEIEAAGIAKVEGFTFYSHAPNARAFGTGANLTIQNCAFNCPGAQNGTSVMSCSFSGFLGLFGVNSYTGTNSTLHFLQVENGGSVIIGDADLFGHITCSVSFTGPSVFASAFIGSNASSNVLLNGDWLSFPGTVPTCPKYACGNAGGIISATGISVNGFLPGSAPGIIYPPGYCNAP